MKFIELHNNEQKIAVRTDCIVSFTETDTVTLVNVVDESNPWHVEETYDEIMEMIRRAEDTWLHVTHWMPLPEPPKAEDDC